MNFKIPVSSPMIGNDDIESVTRCLKSGWVSSMGEDVINFEKKFAEYQQAKYGVATNSGTTALHLALASLGLKENDEILMPTFTMIASANAAEYLGLKIKLIDANPTTWTMDVNNIESKITDKTKAIMAVHIYGHPEDMNYVNKIAADKNLIVIEDAAEAHGAEIDGRKVGTFSNVSSFSFYANKIVTTGEGGMNLTNDRELANRMAWLRAHAFGKDGKHFWHEELGFGYRLSALQGALGVSQVSKIENLVEKRRINAKIYNELLNALSEKGLIVLPKEKKWAKNVYWMYSILVNQKHRDKLMTFLANKGIETRTFFYPIHLQPYYASRYKNENFPVAEKISREGINLPSGNTLSSEDVEEVCLQINNYFKSI
jgi:perosamine synthetase